MKQLGLLDGCDTGLVGMVFPRDWGIVAGYNFLTRPYNPYIGNYTPSIFVPATEGYNRSNLTRLFCVYGHGGYGGVTGLGREVPRSSSQLFFTQVSSDEGQTRFTIICELSQIIVKVGLGLTTFCSRLVTDS